jgi:hypothetical protein
LPPVTAIRNAWGKIRNGALKALRAPRAGIAKTGGGIGRAAAGTRASAARASQAARGKVAAVTERPRARVSSLRERAREHPSVAVGIVGGGLVGIAWIAWAIYVTANNGVNAGLGVLITWPVLIGALALIAAPFVLTAMLVQRHREGSEPAIAGGPALTDEPKEKSEKAEKKAEAEDKSDDVSEDEETEEEKSEAETEDEEPAAKSA